MGRVVEIANQKGGVDKIITTVNLGIVFARKGVLLVDTDSQESLTGKSHRQSWVYET